MDGKGDVIRESIPKIYLVKIYPATATRPSCDRYATVTRPLRDRYATVMRPLRDRYLEGNDESLCLVRHNRLQIR